MPRFGQRLPAGELLFQGADLLHRDDLCRIVHGLRRMGDPRLCSACAALAAAGGALRPPAVGWVARTQLLQASRGAGNSGLLPLPLLFSVQAATLTKARHK